MPCLKQGYSDFIAEIKGQFIDKQIPDLEEIISNLKGITELGPVLNSCFFILDYRTEELLFQSSNYEEITGYNPIEISHSNFLNLFHPTDKKIITEIVYSEGSKAGKKIPLFFLKKMKVSFNFRFLQKDGSYKKLKMQFKTLLYDENKQPLVIMGTNLIYENPSNDIVSEVSYRGPFGKNIIVYKKIFPVNDLESSILTPKELEIVKLVSEGLSSKEIANKTGKSIETVNTQRKNIISKTGTQSMTDVVVLAIKNKWI